MRINRILAALGLLLAWLVPRIAYGQAYWLHKQCYSPGLYGHCLIGSVDSEDYALVPGSPAAALTRDYFHTWHYIFIDTAKRANIDHEYSVSCVAHPTRNLIILGCNADRTIKPQGGGAYLLGGGHILRSTDAGVTWRDTSLGRDTTKPENVIGAMAALDSNHIFLPIYTGTYSLNFTDRDHFLYSSDGGVMWQSIPCPASPNYGGSAYPPDGFVNPSAAYPAPNTLVIAEMDSYLVSKIYRTSNLGQTWSSGFQTNKNITKFFFLNSLVGFATGIIWDSTPKPVAGTIDKTTDGGLTWSNILTLNGAGLFSIAFADSLHGLACGYFGLILRTSDGGKSWTSMASDFTVDDEGVDLLGDVAYPDTNHAIIASSSGEGLVYQPNGILSLPNITYPHFSPPAAPRTFDITWDRVPGATRYSIKITGSIVYVNDTVIANDSNVMATSYHLSDLLDTTPNSKAVEYEI